MAIRKHPAMRGSITATLQHILRLKIAYPCGLQGMGDRTAGGSASKTIKDRFSDSLRC